MSDERRNRALDRTVRTSFNPFQLPRLPRQLPPCIPPVYLGDTVILPRLLPKEQDMDFTKDIAVRILKENEPPVREAWKTVRD